MLYILIICLTLFKYFIKSIMTELVKVFKLKDRHYYTKHLELVNVILENKMTPREMEVLGAFMSIDGGQLTEADRFCTSARKIVKEQLNLKDGGLGNFLKTLKEKKIIFEDKGVLMIPKALFPSNDKEQTYRFILKNEL